MSRSRVLVTVASGAAVAIASAAFVLWPRNATELDEATALDDFRARSSSTVRADEQPTDASVSLVDPTPVAGVYTYTAQGHEEVKLGPFPAERRRLPTTITGVVVAAPDGCFDFAINFFEQHTEETRYCVGDDGSVSIDRHEKHQQVGSIAPTGTMACDPRTIAAPHNVLLPLSCTLSMSGGPLTMNATLVGTATSSTPEPIEVGARTVEAIPVTISHGVSGDLSGSWVETLWFAENRLPVAIKRAVTLSGPATFTETSTLTLTDIAPTT